MTIRLSVVVPAFNAAATLTRAVESVLTQEQPGVEVIVVDDASTDGTADLARDLSARHPQVQAVSLAENRGPAAARNAGLAVARGDYVCFLDSDDAQEPTFLEKTTGTLESFPDLASVKTDVVLEGYDGEIDAVRYATVVNVLPSNVLVRRGVAELISGFPEDPAFRGASAGEDNVFRLILGRCFPQGHLRERLLRHHVGGDSHFRRFMARTRVKDGKLTFTSATAEEADGAIDAASQSFLDAFVDRVRAAAGSRLAVAHLAFHQRAPLLAEEITSFQMLAEQTSSVPGALNPREGHLLCVCAAHGPGNGAVVDATAFKGLSTCWLAAGAKRRDGASVIVAAPHGWAPGDAETGPDLAMTESVLRRAGLADLLEPKGSASEAEGQAWSKPVRLLAVGPDPEGADVEALFSAWAQHVPLGGLAALYGVVRPAVAALDRALRQDAERWRQLYALDGLRVFERIGI